jgi:hypothetical protein
MGIMCCSVDSRAAHQHTKQAEFIPLLWPHSGRSNGSPFKSAARTPLFYCTERFRAICLQCVQIHHLANCDQIALAEPGKEETPFGARSPDHFFLHLEANAWQFSLALFVSSQVKFSDPTTSN